MNMPSLNSCFSTYINLYLKREALNSREGFRNTRRPIIHSLSSPLLRLSNYFPFDAKPRLQSRPLSLHQIIRNGNNNHCGGRKKWLSKSVSVYLSSIKNSLFCRCAVGTIASKSESYITSKSEW